MLEMPADFPGGVVKMTENKTEFQRYLLSVRACAEAREWAGARNARQAWDECERADWLLWWAAMAGVDRKIVVKAACQCERRALRFVPDGEMRPLRAIETAERWCEGRATVQEVRAAAADSYAYAAAAAADSYAYADAYAYAAAAAAAAYAAAAARAAYSKTRADELLEMAAIVREIVPFPGMQAAK